MCMSSKATDRPFQPLPMNFTPAPANATLMDATSADETENNFQTE